MIFFSADTHFGHQNIIKYCNRPFSNVKEMDEAIIKNWNKVVTKSDLVWFLGDISFYKNEQDTLNILNRLNGSINAVLGNHDERLSPKILKRFNYVVNFGTEIKVQDPLASNGKYQHIVLCHYAMKVWNKSHRSSWQLYGHSHGSLKDDPHALQIDVGVDNHDYTPISYEQVKAIMAKKLYKPIDHHGKDNDY